MILKENLQELKQDMWITDNPYDVKRLLINKPKLYRILYDSTKIKRNPLASAGG